MNLQNQLRLKTNGPILLNCLKLYNKTEENSAIFWEKNDFVMRYLGLTSGSNKLVQMGTTNWVYFEKLRTSSCQQVE